MQIITKASKKVTFQVIAHTFFFLGIDISLRDCILCNILIEKGKIGLNVEKTSRGNLMGMLRVLEVVACNSKVNRKGPDLRSQHRIKVIKSIMVTVVCLQTDVCQT